VHFYAFRPALGVLLNTFLNFEGTLGMRRTASETGSLPTTTFFWILRHERYTPTPLWVANSQLAISGDSGPPIFPLEIDEHDQLGAKDTKRERSVTEAYCTKTSNTLVFEAR
jgi:hypothetical protein